MRPKSILSTVLAAGMLGGACLLGAAEPAQAAPGDPLSLTFYNATFFANTPGFTAAGRQRVDFRARVNSSASHLDITAITRNTTFAIDGIARCLGESEARARSFNEIRTSPLTASDDILHLCPFSRGESLNGAIGILES